MLEELRIIGFKCFDTVEISLRKMNLFCGNELFRKIFRYSGFSVVVQQLGKKLLITVERHVAALGYV